MDTDSGIDSEIDSEIDTEIDSGINIRNRQSWNLDAEALDSRTRNWEPGNPEPGAREPGGPPKSAAHFRQILQHPLRPLQCKH